MTSTTEARTSASGGDWRSRVLEVRSRDSGKIAATYSRLAPLYELWARFTQTRQRSRMLELAAVRDGEAVLEVATGTGVQLVELARRNPTGRTTGVDVSNGMLAQTRKHLEQAGLRSVELRKASALELPFEDSSFDVVVNNYMLNLLSHEDIVKALAELKRVLHPGGRVVVSNMTKGEKPLHRVWDALYRRGIDLAANCRGVLAAPALDELGFEDITREYMAQMAFPTEIVTARKRA